MLLKSNEELKLQNHLDDCQMQIKKLENEKMRLLQQMSVADDLSEKQIERQIDQATKILQGQENFNRNMPVNMSYQSSDGVVPGKIIRRAGGLSRTNSN